MPHKHEDLSSIPSESTWKAGRGRPLGSQRQKEPWGLPVSQCRQVGESQVQWECLPQKTGEWERKRHRDVSLWLPHVRVHAFTDEQASSLPAPSGLSSIFSSLTSALSPFLDVTNFPLFTTSHYYGCFLNTPPLPHFLFLPSLAFTTIYNWIHV